MKFQPFKDEPRELFGWNQSRRYSNRIYPPYIKQTIGEVSPEPRFLRKSMGYWKPVDQRKTQAISRVTSADTL